MTIRSLSVAQTRLVQIIQELGFGRIERLSIQNGHPNFDQPPRITQEIKLGSQSEHRPGNTNGDFTLKQEFVILFNELSRLRDGVVDLEVRHRAPFRLILERGCSELVQQGATGRPIQ